MANPALGKAFISVHADTKPFAKELAVEVEAIVKATEPVARSAGEGVGRKVVQGARKGVKKEAPGFFAHIRDIFRKNSSRDRNFFSNIGKSIGESLAHGLSSGGKGIAGLFASIGASVGNVGSKGPFASILGVLITLGIPALIGLVLALVNQLGALVNVIGLLPGALSVLGASIVPVVVAFQGFGEALGAVMEGDPEAIAEALKGLTPAARGVAREFQRMLPFWRELQDVAQEALFSQLAGVFTTFTKQITPTLTRGFAIVATSAGELTRNFLELASSPQILAFLDRLFIATANIMSTMGPALTNLVFALARIADASLPTVVKFSDKIANGIERFAAWLTEISANGQFQAFLDDFGIALDKLILLGKSAWNFVDALLTGTGKDGQAADLFQLIIDCIDTMTAFFSSEVGQKSLEAMVTLAGFFLVSITNAVVVIGVMLATLQAIVDVIKDAIALLDKLLGINTKVNVIRPVTRGIVSEKIASSMQGHADGVISTRQHIAMISEGNRAEAVIPLTDPARARELAARSGLTQLLGGGDTQVVVYIGEEQVMARVEKRVAGAMRAFGRSMKYGPRPVGV